VPNDHRPRQVFGRAVELQSTGKIIVVANTKRFPQTSFIARFPPDGTLDSSFGTDGIVENEVCTFGRAVAISSASGINTDDRIVVAGNTHGVRPCLYRLTPDGALDTSFNHNGLPVFPLQRRGELNAVIVSDGTEGPAGQIVVGGLSDTIPRSGASFMLARINPDGSLDSTFGNNGIVTTASSNGDSVVRRITFYTGTIVAAGFSVFAEEMDATMARYLQ